MIPDVGWVFIGAGATIMLIVFLVLWANFFSADNKQISTYFKGKSSPTGGLTDLYLDSRLMVKTGTLSSSFLGSHYFKTITINDKSHHYVGIDLSKLIEVNGPTYLTEDDTKTVISYV